MKEKIKIIILYLLILMLMINLFFNPNKLALTVLQISIIFMQKVFPFLFVMMVLNKLLLYLNLPYYLHKIFHNNFLYIFIMSILSGSPINAIIIKDYLKQCYLDEKTASKLLAFTCFCNPLFITSYLTIILQDNLTIFKIMLIFYSLNLICFLFISKKLKMHNLVFKKKEFNISQIPLIIKDSIINMLTIYATIVFFKVLTSFLITQNNLSSILLKGLIEITQGLNNLELSTLALQTKSILAITFIHFMGFSIHIQISLILSDYNINYKYFYLSRLIYIVISIILIYHIIP